MSETDKGECVIFELTAIDIKTDYFWTCFCHLLTMLLVLPSGIYMSVDIEIMSCMAIDDPNVSSTRKAKSRLNFTT